MYVFILFPTRDPIRNFSINGKCIKRQRKVHMRMDFIFMYNVHKYD